MRYTILAVVVGSIALMVTPAADAKRKKGSQTSQAGGLPATNAQVAALETAVGNLQAALAAEVAARMAADEALANQGPANQNRLFVADGSVLNIHNATTTIANVTVPAGNYFLLASTQLVNGQQTGNANARCVLSANGVLLADTTELEFPLLSANGATSSSFGSTIFAPLEGSYSAAIPITVAVNCSENAGGNGGLNAFVQIAAMQVSSVQQ